MASVNEKLWKWVEAGEEYRRAISLNPNYATARHWYYIYLKAMKRSQEAEEQIRRAEELDPLSPVININFAQMYLRKGETDRAAEQCKRVIELYPSYPGGYEILAEVYIKQRRYREAVEESSKAAEFSGRASYYLGALGYGYALAGRRADALATLKELEAKYARRESPATDIARVHAGLGDKDQAFMWLEKAFDARSGSLKDVAYEEYFDLLRDDPRYEDLVRRIGLKP
jgi:tetratricopeptide (TPR) repeat protein